MALCSACFNVVDGVNVFGRCGSCQKILDGTMRTKRTMAFVVAFTVPDDDQSDPNDLLEMLQDLTKGAIDPDDPENKDVEINIYEVEV